MVELGDQNDLVDQEIGEVELACREGQGHDSDLDAAGSDLRGDLMAPGLLDVEADSGMRGLESGDGRRQEIGRGGGATAEPGDTALEAEMIGYVTTKEVVAAPGSSLRARPRADQARSARPRVGPAQELRAELRLQLLHPAGERATG